MAELSPCGERTLDCGCALNFHLDRWQNIYQQCDPCHEHRGKLPWKQIAQAMRERKAEGDVFSMRGAYGVEP